MSRTRSSALLAALTLLTCAWVRPASAADCKQLCSETNPESPCHGRRDDPSCVSKCETDCAACDPSTIDTSPPMAMNLFIPNCASIPNPDVVKAALRKNLGQLGLTNPDILVILPQLPCQTGHLSALIWIGPPKNDCEKQARAMTPVPDVIRSDFFAVSIKESLVKWLAQTYLPKIPTAPHVHLSSLDVGFTHKDNLPTVVTEIKGYDDETTPNIDFTTTITDELTDRVGCSPVSDPNCGCDSKTKTDKDGLDEYLAIAIGATSALFAGLSPIPFFPPGVFETPTGDLNALANQPGGGESGGVGCTLWRSLPDEIAFAQTGGFVLARAVTNVPAPNPIHRNKLVFTYGQLPTIDAGAITFRGTPSTAPRTPAVQIVGPAKVTINRYDTEGTARFQVFAKPRQAQDFYVTDGHPLTFAWTTPDAKVTIADPAKRITDATFAIDPTMKPGSRVTRRLTVRVTDQEGSTAVTTRTVQVVKTLTNEPAPTPTPSAECRDDPTLPQCKGLPK